MAGNDQDKYRLWQRPNGIWYIQHGSGANTQRVSTRTKIREKAEQYRAQFLVGLDAPAPEETDVISYYLERYKTDKGPKIRSPDTIKHHLPRLKEFFGKLQPHHISNKTLQEYAEWRKTQGVRRGSRVVEDRPVSNGTILREVGTLKAALGFAAGNRWIASMPVLEAPVKKPPPRDNWLSRGDVKKLIDKARSPHVRLFIQIALATAARSGAILDLEWANVDLDSRLIDFGRGHGNKHRSIAPMNAGLHEAMKTAHELRETPWVIEYCGERVKSVKGAFRRLAGDCNIDATPHVLRHTAATWMVLAGVPLEEIARLLGDSKEMVERVYGKHSPDYLKRATNALDFNV